jgi:transposase
VSEGKANRRIAEELQTSRPTVILWRKRFAEGGPTALTEEVPGRGRKPRISSAKVKQIVEATLHTKPKAATHWSVRSMAQAQGVSPATAQRIWDAHGLEPHRTRSFKRSREKRIRRGSFFSVEELVQAINGYLEENNRQPKPFIWTASVKTILEKVNRRKAILETAH